MKYRLFLFYLDELHVKDERGVGLDGTGAVGTVGEVRRDEQPVGSTLAHQLQTLDPAGDDLTDSKGGGLATLNAAVKYGAVNQLAGIVYGNHYVGTRLFAIALFDDQILQSALGQLNALGVLVLLQVLTS